MRKIGIVDDLLNKWPELHATLTQTLSNLEGQTAMFDLLLSAPQDIVLLPDSEQGVFFQARQKLIGGVEDGLRMFFYADGTFIDDASEAKYAVQQGWVYRYYPVEGDRILVEVPYREIDSDLARHFFYGLASLNVQEGRGAYHKRVTSVRYAVHKVTLSMSDFKEFANRCDEHQWDVEDFDDVKEIVGQELAHAEAAVARAADHLEDFRRIVSDGAAMSAIHNEAFKVVNVRSAMTSAMAHANARIRSLPAGGLRAQYQRQMDVLSERAAGIKEVNLTAIATSAVVDPTARAASLYAPLKDELARLARAYPVLRALTVHEDDHIEVRSATGSVHLNGDGSSRITGTLTDNVRTSTKARATRMQGIRAQRKKRLEAAKD
jgi:hypothetical protein